MITLTSGVCCYAHDLFFVTRDAPFDNLSSKDFNVITHHLTSDIEFDDNLSDENAIENLRLSIISSRPNEYSTADVLHLLDSLKLYDQIIVIGRE